MSSCSWLPDYRLHHSYRGDTYWEETARCGYTGGSEGTIDYVTSSSSKCDYSPPRVFASATMFASWSITRSGCVCNGYCKCHRVSCVTLLSLTSQLTVVVTYWEETARCGYTGGSEGTIDYVTSSSSKCDYSTTKSVCLCYYVC